MPYIVRLYSSEFLSNQGPGSADALMSSVSPDGEERELKHYQHLLSKWFGPTVSIPHARAASKTSHGVERKLLSLRLDEHRI